MRHLAVAAFLFALALGCGKKPAVRNAKSGTETPEDVRLRERADEIVTEYDLNRDKKPDVWKYASKGPDGREVVVRKEKDLNGDGKVDIWEHFDAGAENPGRITYDLDFDGRSDETVFWEKGQAVRKEYAFGFDGKPNSWSFYEKGKLARKERDTNGDGRIDYWEYWEKDEIDRIGMDTDGDGQVDKWERRTVQ